MLKKLSLMLLLSFLSLTASANSLVYIGEGVRQNTTLYTFDSYKIVHHAADTHRALNPDVARILDLTMIASWGGLFTQTRMVEAFEESIKANMTGDEFARYEGEIVRFKKALHLLKINAGSELQFKHNPTERLQLSMKGPSGYKVVFKSADANFSMKVFSIWLGKASSNANNPENLEQLIANLWKNAN